MRDFGLAYRNMRLTPLPPVSIGLLLALGSLFVATTGFAEDAAAYRTVVIFGDTQTLVRHKDAGLERMVDWVTQNRERENIDMVLHVGDIIEDGEKLTIDPRWAEACPGSPDAGAHGACRESCSAARGCVQIRKRCYSCWQLKRDVEAQWRFFNNRWRKLEQAGIPYAMVKGNHDNVGSSSPIEFPQKKTDGQSPTAGYEDHYGAEHWRKLAKRYPSFEYLGGIVDPDPPGASPRHVSRGYPSHVWKFRLGADAGAKQWITLLGLSDQVKNPEILKWAQQALHCRSAAGLAKSCDRNAPAILLAHRNVSKRDFREPGQLWRRYAENEANEGRILAEIEGHYAPSNYAVVETVGAARALRIRFNMQAMKPPRRHMLGLLRFYLDEDQITTVEWLSVDPIADLVRTPEICKERRCNPGLGRHQYQRVGDAGRPFWRLNGAK